MTQTVILEPTTAADQSDEFTVGENESVVVVLHGATSSLPEFTATLQRKIGADAWQDVSTILPNGFPGRVAFSTACRELEVPAMGTYRIDKQATSVAIGAVIEEAA